MQLWKWTAKEGPITNHKVHHTDDKSRQSLELQVIHENNGTVFFSSFLLKMTKMSKITKRSLKWDEKIEICHF